MGPFRNGKATFRTASPCEFKLTWPIAVYGILAFMDEDLAKLRREAQELLNTSKRMLTQARQLIERSRKIQEIIKEKEKVTHYPTSQH